MRTLSPTRQIRERSSSPRHRRGAETLRFATALTSLGLVLVAASTHGVCAILMGDDANALVDDLQQRFPDASLLRDNPSVQSTMNQVISTIESPGCPFDLPLDLRGTAFQQRVWQALTRIPAGEPVSYTELAEMIGSPQAVRAVAGACAANALAVVIPCHRVLRHDGRISGYRWGVERKRQLLAREAARA